MLQCLSIYISICFQNQLTFEWCFLSCFHTKRRVPYSGLQYQQCWILRSVMTKLSLPCIMKSCSCLHSSSSSTIFQNACTLLDVTLNFSTRRGMDTIQSTISCSVFATKLVTALSEGSKLTCKINAYPNLLGLYGNECQLHMVTFRAPITHWIWSWIWTSTKFNNVRWRKIQITIYLHNATICFKLPNSQLHYFLHSLVSMNPSQGYTDNECS